MLYSLIARHGHPTRVSLSSLEELTATCSTYNPPSPSSSSPVSETADSLDALTLSRTVSRPIPIPKPSHHVLDNDLPVTPLTGRFDKGYYFAHRDQSPDRFRDRHNRRRTSRRSPRSSSTRMRSDSSTFYSPVMSPSMSPSGRSSPQPTRARPQNTSKSAPTFHLGNLPRFHPAVYQPSTSSQNLPGQQHIYRTSSSRDPVWQYRELVEGPTISKAPSRPLSPSPSAPRLDPLRSPGPVTPLALEDANSYLMSGAPASSDIMASRDHKHSDPTPDVVERLIARENERTRQKAKKNTKSR
ncbi:hypothetical protein EYZ11_011783 [Aspergillus tanneri]|uniref:Uncharacterized protein n=1 Tax=Aspergillus tanneri TaxID=1220188 RepID=A0A4S3J1X4_9EURO|nr:hypothetical protein EYZ11_011783 [Aspergillus tanneri]